MRIIRFIFLLTVFIMLYSLILSGCEKKTDTAVISEGETDLSTKLDEFMSAFNENSSYKYSGNILVAKGNEILLNKGYGKSNYEENIRNEPDTVFAIGSITKSFTAVAIMQLQEKGLLNVNDPISKYLNGNDRGDDITIHHLLTNTSGLPRDGMFLGEQDVSLDENVAYINKLSLLFEPGEDYAYSNAGYLLLAAIIEKVSGQSYNNYIHEHIFSPLEMEVSRGGIDASYEENQSIGYLLTTNEPKKLLIYNFSSITGSGNIYSIAKDLYKYDRAIENGTLLTKESLDKVFSPEWGDWSNGYGYGWEITKKYGHKKFSHGGNIAGGGYVSMMIKYPEEDYVLVFLTNNADSTALNVVSETMEAIIFGEDYVRPEQTNNIKIDSEVLNQYAGEYDFGNDLLITVSYKKEKLYSTAEDGNTYELLPLSETRFQYQDHQWVKAEFIIDQNSVKLRVRNIDRVFEGQKVN